MVGIVLLGLECGYFRHIKQNIQILNLNNGKANVQANETIDQVPNTNEVENSLTSNTVDTIINETTNNITNNTINNTENNKISNTINNEKINNVNSNKTI